MVTTVEDLAASEQLQARDFFVELEHPQMGKIKCPTTPYHFSRTPSRYDRPAPTLGQHNREILGQRLGYSREELARMRGGGVI
jgi:crotonobetainyl-CoA:carnitine CoA-transferase CaiB-like acyl-CoA transferase